LFTVPRDPHMGHMRPGLRGFMVASTGMKAPFVSGGQRGSRSVWAAMRRMAFTAIRIIGRDAA